MLAATLAVSALVGFSAPMAEAAYSLNPEVKDATPALKEASQIGVLKHERGLAAADPEREVEQIARLRQLAIASNLDPEFAEKLLNFIVSEVVRHHERIARETN